jgi:hypothetical protein
MRSQRPASEFGLELHTVAVLLMALVLLVILGETARDAVAGRFGRARIVAFLRRSDRRSLAVDTQLDQLGEDGGEVIDCTRSVSEVKGRYLACAQNRSLSSAYLWTQGSNSLSWISAMSVGSIISSA